MEWLNGKKTYLGVVMWGVGQALASTWPEYGQLWEVWNVVCLTLTGVGVGHKLDKAKF